MRYDFPGHESDRFYSNALIHRHGAIEVADGLIFDFHDRQVLPGGLLMDVLLGSIKDAILTSSAITGAGAFQIDFRARTHSGAPIAFFNDRYGSGTGRVDREQLVFDPITLLADDGWETEVPQRIKPMLDQIWQAFGYKSCLYFNADGNYQKPN